MKKLALLGGILAATLIAAPLALAQPPTGPGTEECIAARADLVAALAAVLDLSPEVLDGNDEAADLTAPVLASLLDDDEAGEGAQAVIRAALAVHAEVVLACAPPTTTAPPTSTTPAPTTAPIPTPDPTLPPPDGDDDDTDDAPPPVIVDGGVTVTH